MPTSDPQPPAAGDPKSGESWQELARRVPASRRAGAMMAPEGSFEPSKPR